jgi:cytochrome c oxidase subunit 2
MNGLDPHGPDASHIAGLFWLMVAIGGAIYVVTMAILVVALFRRRPRLNDSASRNDRAFIIAGGVIVPTVVLAVIAFATVRVTNRVTAARDDPVHIDVVGYQCWWQVVYPGTTAVTANEIHIPVGRPVELGLESVDVIHSFWVPDLAGKVDLIPGRRNTLSLQADRAGTYRGQCAEFCGLQHTHMALLVIADPPDTFDDWLRAQAKPAGSSSPVFDQATCAGCHTIRGTHARGDIGPDLTHLASRSTLGSVTVPNTHENLARWITDAQSMKPGSNMPPVELSPADLDALVAYLESLD